MPRAEVEFLPEAVSEARVAHDWYAARSPLAAAAFLAELDRVIGLIGRTASAWPPHRHRTRRVILARFPYGVVYRPAMTGILIVAVAHSSRKPGYWKGR